MAGRSLSPSRLKLFWSILMTLQGKEMAYNIAKPPKKVLAHGIRTVCIYSYCGNKQFGDIPSLRAKQNVNRATLSSGMPLFTF